MLLVLNLLLKLFRRSEQAQEPSEPYFQAFILEPILTPSAFVDNPFDSEEVPDVDDVLGDEVPLPPSVGENSATQFDAGVFTVGESGEVGIEFLFDGGKYKGELGIFSLEGMGDLEPGSEEFIAEAAERAFSNTEEGYIVISDKTEGALFDGTLGEKTDWNAGEYKGVKNLQMKAGTKFGVMLVPNGTVEEVMENPDIGGAKTPLFSLATANPDDGLHLGQIADVDGDGNTFVMEDIRMDRGSDEDYNDFIFRVTGATGEAPDMDDFIDPDLDWRETETGLEILDYVTVEEVEQENQPLIGVIDTGFSEENPDLDYSRLTLGSDLIDGDDNPLLSEGEGSEHGDGVLGIIGATQDNDLGIDGINDDAPLWVGRAVGSGKWAESLVEFVDAAQESGQPNAVVNLSMDLTQIDVEGNVSTRYEFTPLEMAALEYARQNDVLVAVAAGNDGGVMSALGQASEQFDNIITVGAADGMERADYSSYGEGLDIVAEGGTLENPVLSTVGDRVEGMHGTSVATAQVTGAISRIWATNPELHYRQVIDILKETAIDLKEPGWDLETGAGLLNMAAAVNLAQSKQEEEYEKELQYVPLTWSGEGEVTPMERAANNGSSGSASGSLPSWSSFLGIFGNPTSSGFVNLLQQVFEKFYNHIVLPDPDNNGEINKAKPIQSNDAIADFVGVSDRHDVYTFTLDRSQYVDIQLDGLSADANIELIRDGEVLFKSTKEGINAELITQFLKKGQYYVKVSSNSNNGTTPYNLKIRSWSSVQPDNGPQPINGKQPVTGKIDSVYFSDVTGNSLADALVVNNWGTTTRRSNGSLFLGNETWIEKPYFGSHRTFFTDVNGDGKADAIGVNDYIHPNFDGVYVKLSNGSGFGATQKWTDIGYNGKHGIFFSDVTGDGKADAIVSIDSGIFVRRSDGTKFLPNEKWTDIGYGGKYGTFFADVTGDGKADAIVVNDGGVTVRRSDGTKFLPNEKWTDIGYGGKHGTFFADVTGDGKADAIVVNDGAVTVRRSDGTKFLPNETWTDIGYNGKHGIFFSDVTGDGKADAIVSNDNGVTIRRSDGTKFLPNEKWTNIGYGGEGGPGSIVKGSGPEVYLVDGIKRRHIPDRETLGYLGGHITPQNYISDSDLNFIALGDPLPSRRNGTLLQGSAGAVHIMENGHRRLIPDPETFNALGLNWGAIQTIADRDLNVIPLGSPIPSSKNGGPIANYAQYIQRLYGHNNGRITQYPHGGHNAIDSANDGAYPYKVYSLTGGVVQLITTDRYGGKFVKIWNEQLKRHFYYVHFAGFNPNLRVGQTINAGYYLGNEGNTGNSRGRHTHVHVRRPDGEKEHPLISLGKL